jgi:AbrB family looped-hinge helix DNA binding protein
MIKHMKTDVVILSGKYQVVIPKAARKKLGLSKPDGQRFKVERVSKDEIVFRKDKSLDDFLGQYGNAFENEATTKLRKIRDQEW